MNTSADPAEGTMGIEICSIHATGALNAIASATAERKGVWLRD